MRSRVLAVLLGLTVVAGCFGTPASSPAPAPSAPSSPAPPPSSSVPSSSPTPAPTPSPSPAAQGVVVVLDPGHNGGNASNPGVINKPVPAGRGATKPCNTTGTSTNAGYPEHAFTWDVAQRVGAELRARGIKVVYTRDSDSGVGPCVNDRAAAGNAANATAVVSIHGDGSTSPGARGFHVEYSSPPLNAAQREPAMALARALRDSIGKDFPISNYLGNDGLASRADLAGLNLSTRPAVLIECGNMRNAADAAQMSTADGRQHYADAITAGILAYVG